MTVRKKTRKHISNYLFTTLITLCCLSSWAAIPVEGVTVPVEGVTVPVEGVTVPVEGVTVPAEGVTVPVEGVTVPVEGVTVPVEGATGESIRLRMLVWEGYAPEVYREFFIEEMAYLYNLNVEIEIDYITKPEEFLETLVRRGHDIISPTHNILKSPRWPLIEEELVLPLRIKNIPNFQKVSPGMRNSHFLTKDGEVYAAAFIHGKYGLVYNSDIMPEPDSWTVFWDPKYAQQYAVSADYPEVNIYITALSLGFKKEDLADTSILEKPAFIEHLTMLAQNAKRVWHSSDSVEVLSGLKFSAAWGFSLPDLNEKGEPWKIAHPIEGTPSHVDTWAIAAHLQEMPTHRWVAEKWIDFTLSDEAQLGYLRNLASTPMNEEVARIASPEEIEQYHIGDRQYFDKLLMWPILPKDSHTLYRKAWDAAFKQPLLTPQTKK